MSLCLCRQEVFDDVAAVYCSKTFTQFQRRYDTTRSRSVDYGEAWITSYRQLQLFQLNEGIVESLHLVVCVSDY